MRISASKVLTFLEKVNLRVERIYVEDGNVVLLLCEYTAIGTNVCVTIPKRARMTPPTGSGYDVQYVKGSVSSAAEYADVYSYLSFIGPADGTLGIASLLPNAVFTKMGGVMTHYTTTTDARGSSRSAKTGCTDDSSSDLKMLEDAVLGAHAQLRPNEVLPVTIRPAETRKVVMYVNDEVLDADTARFIESNIDIKSEDESEDTESEDESEDSGSEGKDTESEDTESEGKDTESEGKDTESEDSGSEGKDTESGDSGSEGKKEQGPAHRVVNKIGADLVVHQPSRAQFVQIVAPPAGVAVLCVCLRTISATGSDFESVLSSAVASVERNEQLYITENAHIIRGLCARLTRQLDDMLRTASERVAEANQRAQRVQQLAAHINSIPDKERRGAMQAKTDDLLRSIRVEGVKTKLDLLDSVLTTRHILNDLVTQNNE